MQLFFLHYHLNRGGVTSVIRTHLQSLAQAEGASISRVVIGYGGRSADWDRSFEEGLSFAVEYAVLPSLEYDQLQGPSCRSDLYGEIIELLKASDAAKHNTVLHIHNHGLGKNSALPRAVTQLADDGWRLVLQIHDFAEDLRPENYAHLLDTVGDQQVLRALLYPQAPQIRYAVLNLRDYRVLEVAGVPPRCLTSLPNPVALDEPISQETEIREVARRKLMERYGVGMETPYVLYPVRGIRRKNLGELLLWASLVG